MITKSRLNRTQLIALLLPGLLLFAAFTVYPIIRLFWMSLCDVQIDAKGIHPIFWGLTSYNKAFNIDPDFRRMMTEELGRMVTHTLAILVVSLVIAIILNQEFKGRAFVRAVFFLPVILSSGVLVGLENNNSLMSSIQPHPPRLDSLPRPPRWRHWCARCCPPNRQSPKRG